MTCTIGYRLTADLVTLDGSDTNAYGEGCLEGHGYTLASGWWENGGDTVSEEQTPVIEFTLDDPKHDDPFWCEHPGVPCHVKWLATAISEMVGGGRHGAEWDGGGTIYGTGEIVVSGEHDEHEITARPALHPVGYRDEEIEAAMVIAWPHGIVNGRRFTFRVAL